MKMKIFENFTLLLFSSLGEGELYFIWTILNAFYQKMIYANLGYNWPNSSGDVLVDIAKSNKQMDGQWMIRKAHLVS
jgi:hypothetical protein